MINVCLVGGLGRMGRTIASLAQEEPDIRIVSVWETPQVIAGSGDYSAATGYAKSPVTVSAQGKDAVVSADVVVDFATAVAFDQVVCVCEEFSKPLVTGSTAVPDKERKLEQLAENVAVVNSPNMATGINVVFALSRTLGESIGEASDIEIVETHHRTKRDVPSGTALEIGRILSSCTGKPVRVGRTEESTERADEIVIHSVRVGDVAGKHVIVLSPKGETLEISHTAQSRACFAAGALRAVRFAVKSPPGLYNMLDVLGISTWEEGSS
jgi:4-hydroxy-tetrahydrodipicolinate reductase